MSIVSNEKSFLPYTLSTKIGQMAKSQLPELIRKAKSAGLSFRDIQRRAGGDKAIALSTLNQMDKGKADNLTLQKILALAKGLGESPTVVFEAAIGKAPAAFKDDSIRQFLENFANLPARDREELRLSLEMLMAEVQRRLDRDT